MKSKSLYLTFFVFLWMPYSPTQAAEFFREVTIKEITAIAKDRPLAVNSQNIVRVYVNSEAWGTSTCRQDAADLKSDDKHLIATLFAAQAVGDSLKIGVEDSRRPVDSTCQIVFITRTPKP